MAFKVPVDLKGLDRVDRLATQMKEERLRKLLLENTKIEDGEDGCWIWTGSVTKRGYGRINRNDNRAIHRLAYTTFVAPVPPDLELDHTCENKRCWRPEHLEPVTQLENARRYQERRLLRKQLLT
jgi:hypothetical protein